MGETVDRGVEIHRLCLVDDPLTRYQELVLAACRLNDTAGEQVRVGLLRDYPNPGGGLWLIDRQQVAHLRFGPDGTRLDLDLADADDDVLAWAERWETALPLPAL